MTLMFTKGTRFLMVWDGWDVLVGSMSVTIAPRKLSPKLTLLSYPTPRYKWKMALA